MTPNDIVDMYQVLCTHYGSTYKRNFSENLVRDYWPEHLSRFTRAEAVSAVREWIQENPDRGPNLPQLRAKISQIRYKLGYEPPKVVTQPGSAEWKASKARGKAFLDRLRHLMANARPFTDEERMQCYHALQTDDLDTVKRLLREVGAELP